MNHTSKTFLFSSSIIGCFLLCFVNSIVAATQIGKSLVASGLTEPLFVASARLDKTRLYVVEKNGIIKLIKNGVLLPTPFLDITDRVLNNASERGLLGLAFSPTYPFSSNSFYVNYTDGGGASVVSRFRIFDDPDSAVRDSEEIIITIPQPFINHNGGMIAFGPNDGYLYVGMGDGGGANDPQSNGQKPTTLLGKMLRLNVSLPGPGYQIPPTNPFVISDTAEHEIWAFGLRNPWRWSFDRLNGNLWIADVGQALREEIDWQSAASQGGENYGWRLKEGLSCFIPSASCDPGSMLTDPITQYFHGSGRCSITGGYVYSGCAIPDLQGTYFYGDYCTGEIWSFRYDGTNISDSTDRTPELGLNGFDLVSFGEDAEGEIYMVGITSGDIYKIVPADKEPVSCGSCCSGTVGNVDYSFDGIVDISDLTSLIDFLFISQLPVYCDGEANIDASPDGIIDVSDWTLLIDYLFISFNQLPSCPQ
ncbi:MAG: PQQ-dependent sugar dehydrogenase [candidate division Zixibacteria bacterium]|nr:PQQ-dependent sugar dehydrogenase [candidate division Zixibacteria bacterium]